MKKLLNSEGYGLCLFKLSLKMKLTVLLTIVSLFQIQANSYSQSKKISLDISNAPLETIIHKIEAASEFKFLLNRNDVDLNRKVTIKVDNKKIAVILSKLFENTDVTFEVLNKQIILSRKKLKVNSSNQVLLPDPGLKTKQYQVTGVIRDQDGTPLPGANVVEKGTTNGVTADFDGNFSIEVENSNAILLVSYIGFATKEVSVNGQSEIVVVLVESAAGLEEVVIIGYGSQRKQDLTGSISTIKTTELQETPMTAIDQALVGRASGVMVTQTSGMPGAVASIRIRGSSSLQGGNEPLYVVDGFPIYNGSGFGNTGGNSSLSGLSTINPSDIESIEILKDASATSIYGARAANGVVLITTKRGKKGQDNISFEAYYGLQSLARKIEVMNAYDYAQLVNEAYTNDGLNPVYSNEKLSELQSNPKGTDWQDEFFRSGQTQNYQLSFSGGDEKTMYLISGNYFEQDGIITNSDFNRYSGRVNLERKVKDNFKIGANLSISSTKANTVRADSGETGVVLSAMMFNPILPVYTNKELGEYTPINTPGIIYANPIATVNEQKWENLSTRFLGNVFGELEIVPNLKAKISLGVDLFNLKYKDFTPTTIYESNGVASATVSGGNTTNWLNENTLSWNKVINENNTISLLGGITFQRNLYEGFLASSQDYVNNTLGANSLESGAIYNQPNSDKMEWSLLSYLGRLNYNYKDKYLLTFSSRIDGSSRFGENNKYAFFPSGSAAWRILEEDFMDGQNVFSNFKVRASYGLTGNQEIGLYSSLPTLTNTTYTIGRSLGTGFYPNIIPNPDLRWEKTAQWNIGLDLGFFRNRLRVTSDYYYKKTTDLIYSVAVPYVSGFETSLQNLGSVGNQGLELAVESDNFSGDFNWTTNFNISFNKNRVLELGGESYKEVGSGQLKSGAVHRLMIDEPIGLFYGYVSDGIFQNQDELNNGPAGPTNWMGGRRYKDISGEDGVPDGKIDATFDRTIIGDPNPDFYGGMSNTLSYSGIELNIFLQYSYGNELLNYNAMQLLLPSGGQNVYQELINRWTPDNPSDVYPLATTNRSSIFSDTFIEDGSYLKIKTLTLAYTFPKLKSDYLSGMRVYVTGQNLFTFTSYKGYDPEVSYRGASNLEIGEDFGGYPQSKTIMMGLKLDLK